MIGGAVGIATGLTGFLVLKKFAYTVVLRKRSAVLFGIIQPLLIISGLLCCAVFVPGQILHAGLGTALVIIAGSIITTVKNIVVCPAVGSEKSVKEGDIL